MTPFSHIFLHGQAKAGRNFTHKHTHIDHNKMFRKTFNMLKYKTTAPSSGYTGTEQPAVHTIHT